MQLLCLSSTILLLQALILPTLASSSYPYDGLARNCTPKGHPTKRLLSFDDIPTNSTSGFTQISTTNTSLIYKGFTFSQPSQWFLLDCTRFPPSNPYAKACAPGSSKALWSPNNSDNSSFAVGVFRGGPGLVFDVDSFWITPVAFGEREVVVRITGRYAKGGIGAGVEEPRYERRVITDRRVKVGGLRRRGFVELRELEVHVWDGESGVVFAIDEVEVGVYGTDCGY